MSMLYFIFNFLQPGDYDLYIEFVGNLNDQLRGFYRNKYTTPNGETRYAAVTHFEVRFKIVLFYALKTFL